MTDHRINAVIALACKWQPNCNNGICWDSAGNVVLNPPNYCGDLNAMHEAERTLKPIDLHVMSIWLARILPKDGEWFHATARQRAEAFLRTIGKWEEGK